MKDDEVKKYLFDIREAIHSINDYLGEQRNFEMYSDNKMLRRAVERELEIIGKAVNKLVKLDSALHISSKKQIINLRNRVIHSYDKVDNAIVWGIIVKHLPVLKNEVEILLAL